MDVLGVSWDFGDSDEQKPIHHFGSGEIFFQQNCAPQSLRIADTILLDLSRLRELENSLIDTGVEPASIYSIIPIKLYSIDAGAQPALNPRMLVRRALSSET